jgi:hypothetical protein
VKFAQGKVAYERGQYPASARLLEQALNEEGPFTQLGGEIQLWLALAYQVRWGERRQLQQKNAGRASALVPNTPRILCIAAHVQKRLWVPPLRPQRCCFTHLPPFCCVLRQACGREEDCLSVYRNVEKSHPLPAIRRQAADLRYIMEAPRLQINPEERVQIPVLTDLDVNRGNRTPMPRPRVPQKRRVPKTWDEEFWDNYKGPAGLVQNRYVWAAASIAATVAAVYSSYVQRGLLR